MINAQTKPGIVQPKKSTMKFWLIGCGLLAVLFLAVLGAVAYYLLTPSDEPLEGNLSFPTAVNAGDTFEFVVTMTNSTTDPIFINHVVLFHLLDAPFLLDGVRVIGTEPEMSSGLLQPRGDVEFAYFREIKPGESQQVVFHLQAEKAATYAINLGVFARHPSKPDPAYITALHIPGIQIDITP